jgi:hypothetical protein
MGDKESAVDLLTSAQLEGIANSDVKELDAMSASQPRSAHMGYRSIQGDKTFAKKEVVLFSPLVAGKVYIKLLKRLWNTVVHGGRKSWASFEECYLRVDCDRKEYIWISQTRCRSRQKNRQ